MAMVIRNSVRPADMDHEFALAAVQRRAQAGKLRRH